RLETANQDFARSIQKHHEDLEASKKSLKLKADILEDKIKVINQLELTLEEKEKKLLSLNEEISSKQSIIESAQSDVIEFLNHVSEKKNAISKLDTLKANLEKRLNQI